MSTVDLIRFAFQALSGHRLRTLLSLLGMAVGVAAVVILTALGEGARRYVTAQFADLGTNLVIVVPGKNETTGTVPSTAGVPNDLTLGDASAILRHVPDAWRVAPLATGTETVAFGERRRQVAVFGTNRDYFVMRQLSASAGEVLPAGELDRGAPVVVLGRETSRELFGNEQPVGQIVRVGDWRMRVIGVMESKGVQLGVDLDDLAMVPTATAMRMFDRSSLFRLLIEVRPGRDLDRVREQVIALITDRHGEEDITCLTQDAVLDTFSSIMGALTLALGAIAAVSLSVAGIGIMNVMLVSVSERTGEVGLLKALGAHRRQVLGLFVTEATLLSLAGGLLGLGLGQVGVAFLIRLFPALPAAAPTWAIVAAMSVALVVGVVFGVLPARRAAGLDPVLALGRGT